jgi:uncharacterized peroxidase-related enzyme
VCHHGRGLFQITKNKALVEAIKTDFRKADVPKKDIAMLDYAEKLTTDQCNMKQSDVVKLRKSGFKDSDILDIVQVVAYYNYVNRLACGLGVELEPYWQAKQHRP